MRVEAEGDPRAWHPPLLEVADFDRVAAQRDSLTSVELVANTGWQIPDPSWRWSQPLAIEVGANERIVGVRVQQFRARVLTVPLRTRWRTSDLEFVGRPAQLVVADLAPLRHRAQVAGVAAAVVALLGLGLTLQYRARSEWFIEYGHGPGLALLAMVGGVLAGLLVLGVSLPERERWRWLGPAVGLGVVLVAGFGAWFSAQPSLDVAKQAVEQGDLDRGEFELDALVALGQTSPELATLQKRIIEERGTRADDARLRRLGTTNSLETAGAVLREQWFDPDRREPKLDAHLARARKAIEVAWDERDADELRSVVPAIEGLDDELAAEAGVLAELVDVRVAIETPDLALAVERFGAATELDAAADHRATIEEELIAALAQAARDQYALGFDKRRSSSDRIYALDRFIVYESTLRELSGAGLEGLDVKDAEKQKAALAEQAAAEQARAQAAEERRIAAERRRAKRAARSSSRTRPSRSSGGSSSGGCCKVCSNSQPCGDSCISWSKTCRKGPGCAC